MAPRRSKTPPPTLVLFVRHGRTPTTGAVLPGRAKGLHLSDEGRAQAVAAAERVAALVEPGGAPSGGGQPRHGARSPKPAPSGRRGRRIEAVYASPLERARETAAPIAERLGLGVTIERGLLECDFGEWTGAELKALAKLAEWRTVQRWPSGWRFPGGESFPEMQARVLAAVGRLRSRHPGGTVVAVSHADPIKAAVADALGTHLDLFQRVVISPCSITAVAYGDAGPTVLAVNTTAALGDLVPS